MVKGSEFEQQWRAAEPGAVLLDGFHALKHAVRFGAHVRIALTSDKKAIRALADELSSDVADRMDSLLTEVPAQTLTRLFPRVHPTGVAALASRPDAHANRLALTVRPRSAPVVVLENPRNLGNVGAVIRLAAGFGITGVVTTGNMDPWHANVIRGSSGLHFATAVERLSPAELPAGPIYVLDPEGDDLRTTHLPDDAVLAFGSERHGVTAELRERAARRLAIPMRPGVSSYNLATSVAMTLFRWSEVGA